MAHREEAQLHTHQVIQKMKTELYGLRAFTDAVCKHNVPLVLFSGCTDIYLTLASVYGEHYLSTYAQFLTLVSNTFPRCFDLKIFVDLPPIINHLKTNLSLGSRSLSQIFKITSYGLQSAQSDADDNNMVHDAGYDSLMTALSFEWVLGHFLAITGTISSMITSVCSTRSLLSRSTKIYPQLIFHYFSITAGISSTSTRARFHIH